MKNNHMVMVMSNKEIVSNPFVDKEGKSLFYRFVAEKFAPYDDIKSIDCRKINVAKDIQAAWYNYASDNGISASDLSMTILFSGPKALPELPDSTVELEDGAIEW